MRYIFFFACCTTFISCWPYKSPPEDYYVDVKRWAWKPVYGANNDYKKVTWHNTARAVEKAGKIYVFGNLIFQNDIGKGIHVIDNSIPAQAHRIAFIEIPGNSELSIKDQSLFVNNYMDVVEIDISNPANPVERARVRNAFDTYDVNYTYEWQAPADSGYFKCPQQYIDSVVVGWVRDSVYANCYKN